LDVLSGAVSVRTARLMTDLGVMYNLGVHDAAGASLFATLDDYGWSAGASVRYRRWWKGDHSLDIAVGTPLVWSGTSFYNMMSGPERSSIMGLIRYSPVPWFALAVRPEILQHTDCAEPRVGCAESRLVLRPDGSGWSPQPPDLRTVRTSRVLMGVEFSEKPGAVLSSAWWGLALLGGALVAAGGN
jgi:hypothetical protein